MIQVVEITGRSEQGMTKPFICHCDDDEVYFVKGIGTGRRSLICEWIAGRMAQALELPIAPFEIAHVPDELMAMSGATAELSDLGAGPAFASRRCEIMEMTAAAVEDVPRTLQRDVLAFDWWVRNEDRTLTANGGNPNLFWKPGSKELVVIDHNQAFDKTFDIAKFFDQHVFSDSQHDLFGDMLLREEYEQRFAVALSEWTNIINDMPMEWLHLDPEMVDPAHFDLEDFRAVLERYQQDYFWKTS